MSPACALARPAGDFAVFQALRPDLVRVAAALLRHSRVQSEPEDLVQTVLTRIYAGLQAGTIDLVRIHNPRYFAYAALRNLFFDESKALRNRSETSLDETGVEALRDPAAAPERDSLLVRQVLARLPPAQRRFLVSVVFEERSVEEAQRLCGWPARSPYYHLKALLERVRAMVDEPSL